MIKPEYIKYIVILFGALLALPIFSVGNRGEVALYGIIILTAVSAVFFYLKKLDARLLALAYVSYLLVFVSVVFYAVPTTAISVSTGPILNDNWWNGLNWIQQNTAECATVATYWDPGHFIRAIAKRPIIFGGASQNDIKVMPYNGTKRGFEIVPLDYGIKQLVMYEDGKMTRAKIKDIGTILMTSNESLAVELLEDYRNGCDELYFLATQDLIFKSVWWTYFATWDPTASGQKGVQIPYSFIQQSRRVPIQSLGVIGFEYPVGNDQSIILCQNNSAVTSCNKSIIGMFKAGNNFVRLSKLIYPVESGFQVIEDPAGEIKGTVYVPDPSGKQIIYMPQELENAMFTRMFFFNGIRLKNFELVGNWGGEFKLYKVHFSD